MFVALALASAAFYGAADFLGGIASRRAQTVVVTLVSQAAGLILLALLIPVLPSASPVPSDYLWGVASGFAGSAGVALLYRALAVGHDVDRRADRPRCVRSRFPCSSRLRSASGRAFCLWPASRWRSWRLRS